MYVGSGQPRFREGKGLFFKSRGFVGYLHKYKRAIPTIIGKLHVTHPSNELTPLSIVFDCGNRCPLGGSARISRFDLGFVEQDHVQQGIMDLEFSVVFDKTQFALELNNNWSISSSSIRLFRFNRYVMNSSEKSGSL